LTALYLLNLAEREPIRYSITLKAGTNATRLTKQGVKVYKVKEELFDVGVIEAKSPAGHMLKVYNPERTICDLVRSRRNIERFLERLSISSYRDNLILKGGTLISAMVGQDSRTTMDIDAIVKTFPFL